ncbi:MAG: hypothetical protein ACI835_003985 [Planctomycetota bacterium]|jgi:hypothetical protein
MLHSILTTLLLALPAAGIAWEESLAATLQRAADEQRVVFIAINMDGERANDRMVDDVYKDKNIVALSELTLNLVGSVTPHTKLGRCSRFGSIECESHRLVESDIRGRFLRPDADGHVIAPQHLFLDPAGAVLLSVPYGVTSEELEWCFAAALRKVDPTLKLDLSSGARAPKRVVMGGVADAADIETPPTQAEVEQIIKDIRKGTIRGGQRLTAIMRLLLSDDPEAMKMVQTELLGGRGGRGGRGGGRGDGEDTASAKARIMHRMGKVSPTAYWEVALEFLSSTEEALRFEAIATLEQLARKETLKDLRNALRKAEDPRSERSLLRATAAAGAGDKRTRTDLLKKCSSEKDMLLRTNAVLALGHLAAHKDVDAALTELLTESGGPESLSMAAALAMAMTREGSWVELLSSVVARAPDTPLAKACTASIKALEDGSLNAIQAIFMRVSRDEIVRERLFGAAAGGN